MINLKKRVPFLFGGRRQKAYDKLMKRKRIYRKVQRSVKRRNRAEFRFRCYGIMAIAVSVVFLSVLFFHIISSGYTAFTQTHIRTQLVFTPELVEGDRYDTIATDGLKRAFPDIADPASVRLLVRLMSPGAAYQLQDMVREDPTLKGQVKEVWLLASSDVDVYVKRQGKKNMVSANHKLNRQQLKWIRSLQKQGAVKQVFNTYFFTRGDSRNPELAGILGAMAGSFFVIISCMIVALPLGVLTAIYLEEFSPRNRLSECIEVNINNLAAVPSIVFGLLGLTVYIQFMGIPRSAALAGGLTLALMALPVMVIATRVAIRAIPPSIREGAIALGASKLQVVVHHVLPLAMPGIMTGMILSIARVLGETAPLLMIGMVAFVVDIPENFLKASTALPVQIYLWSDSAEAGFIEKTSAAILVLLFFLVAANALAVFLRKRLEVKW
jgi:phosphate transport system permease protein